MAAKEQPQGVVDDPLADVLGGGAPAPQTAPKPKRRSRSRRGGGEDPRSSTPKRNRERKVDPQTAASSPGAKASKLDDEPVKPLYVRSPESVRRRLWLVVGKLRELDVDTSQQDIINALIVSEVDPEDPECLEELRRKLLAYEARR